MFSVLKTILITFYLFLLRILAFLCISYNSTINTEQFKSFVEVYLIEGNPIEVYPIEAYLIGKGVVEVSGCPKRELQVCSKAKFRSKTSYCLYLTTGIK
jgi:hypothetical protein